MEVVYLYALIILGVLFAALVLLKTLILNKDKVKKPKALKKRIEELNKRIKKNQYDYGKQPHNILLINSIKLRKFKRI